jgi:hypothetical protein
MTLQKLRNHLYGKCDMRDSLIRRRAIRKAEDKAVEDVCAKYRRHAKLDPQPFTPDELRRAQRALARWERHTSCPAPHYPDDEMLVMERSWRRVKLAWWVLGVLVAVIVAWRWASGGGE